LFWKDQFSSSSDDQSTGLRKDDVTHVIKGEARCPLHP
jgi:hypothetical protein